MLNMGGPLIEYNTIQVLRAKIRVYYLYCNHSKTRPPLVFSILGARTRAARRWRGRAQLQCLPAGGAQGRAHLGC